MNELTIYPLHSAYQVLATTAYLSVQYVIIRFSFYCQGCDLLPQGTGVFAVGTVKNMSADMMQTSVGILPVHLQKISVLLISHCQYIHFLRQ